LKAIYEILKLLLKKNTKSFGCSFLASSS